MKKSLIRVTTFSMISLVSSSVFAASIMYIPTGGSNEIVLIDSDKDQIVGRIGELENAHGLSTSNNSEYLVAGSMNPTESGKETKLSKPAAVSDAEHDAHHASGSNGDNNSSSAVLKSPSYISIVHPKHGHVMRRIVVQGLTHHTAVSPDGKIAIAVHSGTGGISVIDLERNTVINTVKTGMWPNYAVFTSDGKKLYVSNAHPGTISEIDTASWTETREMKVGKEPEHLVFDKENKILYVANKASASVSALDIKTGKVKSTFTTGKKPHGVDLSDDGRYMFIASNGSETLTRVDLSNNDEKSIDLKPAPYHLSYINGKNKIYVSSRETPTIWVIDSNNLKIEKSIDIGKGVAHQMVMRIE